MAKAIREADGKVLLHRHLQELLKERRGDLQLPLFRTVSVKADGTGLADIADHYSWMKNEVRHWCFANVL